MQRSSLAVTNTKTSRFEDMMVERRVVQLVAKVITGDFQLGSATGAAADTTVLNALTASFANAVMQVGMRQAKHTARLCVRDWISVSSTAPHRVKRLKDQMIMMKNISPRTGTETRAIAYLGVSLSEWIRYTNQAIGAEARAHERRSCRRTWLATQWRRRPMRLALLPD